MIRNVFSIIATLFIAAPAIHAFNLDDERWRTSPVTMHLQLGTISGSLIDGSTSWGAVAEDALATWNGVLTNFRFTVVRDSTVAQARSNRLNNVFFSSTVYGSTFDRFTLAVTLLSTSSTNGVSNGFTEADVLFNTAFSWNSYRGNLRNASGGGTLQDFRRVAIHEFGHALGLNHPDDIGQSVSAIMNSVTSNTDTITGDDIAGARAIYDGNTVAVAPSITTQPTSRTVTVGASTTFTVVATGAAQLTYQWFRNGSTAITGATAASFTLSNVQPANAASYTVVVANSAGSITSNAATLTVNSATVAPTISAQPVAQAVTVGSPASFTVTATGTAPLTFQWRKNGTAIPGAANSQTLTLPATVAADAGTYSVSVSNSVGSILSALATLTVNPAGPASRLSGLSVRTTLAVRQTVTVGFTMTGTQTKPVLVRAVGPSLAPFNIADRMADPSLVLFNAANPPVRIAENDDWFGSSTIANTAAALGSFALASPASLDAALIRDISGGHTVQVSGSSFAANAAATAGTVIVEVYDAGSGNTPRLTSLSALNRVGTGGNILIAGFTLSGTGEKRLLIRGVGPSLAAPPFNLTGALADPKLEVFTATAAPELIGTNDTYNASLAPVFASVGSFALVSGSRDAAFIVSLPPGGYTVQVSGADGGTGLAIVEVYELP
jgi:hypothetical protein